MKVLLLVDDDGEFREIIAGLLKNCGYMVLCATDGMHALEIFMTGKGIIELVITDYQMPKIDGVKLCHEIRKINSEVPIIIWTAGNYEEKLAQECKGMENVAIHIKDENVVRLVHLAERKFCSG